MKERFIITYHGDGERVDAFDIQKAVVPGDETLHVDVQLVPERHDGLIALLVSVERTEIHRVFALS